LLVVGRLSVGNRILLENSFVLRGKDLELQRYNVWILFFLKFKPKKNHPDVKDGFILKIIILRN